MYIIHFQIVYILQDIIAILCVEFFKKNTKKVIWRYKGDRNKSPDSKTLWYNLFVTLDTLDSIKCATGIV